MKLLFDADEDFCCSSVQALLHWTSSLAADIMSTYKKKQSSSSAIQNKFLHYKTTEIKSVVFCLVDIACSPNVGVVIT
jgi:hypothetical protein